MQKIFFILQIVIPIVLILFILLQQRGEALGSAFGGAGGTTSYFKRRGLEKKLFWATIICGILFATISLLNLVIQSY